MISIDSREDDDDEADFGGMRRRRCRSSVTPRVVESVLGVVCVLGVASLSRALEIRVRAGETECVTERVREARTMVSGSWFVTRASNANAPSERGPGYGDHYDDYHYWERHSDAFDARGSLESSDSSEAGEEIYNALGKTEHRFEFEARNVGELRMCFTNSGGRDASVSYSASLGRQWDHNKAKEQHVDSAYAELNNVETRVGSLLEEVRYHEQRAKRHQRTNVVVSKRVVRWSIIEALAIVCASYYQFYYVKKLFEKRDRRGGFTRV